MLSGKSGAYDVVSQTLYHLYQAHNTYFLYGLCSADAYHLHYSIIGLCPHRPVVSNTAQRVDPELVLVCQLDHKPEQTYYFGPQLLRLFVLDVLE